MWDFQDINLLKNYQVEKKNKKKKLLGRVITVIKSYNRLCMCVSIYMCVYIYIYII